MCKFTAISVFIYVFYLLSKISDCNADCGEAMKLKTPGKIVGGDPVGSYRYPWFAILQSVGIPSYLHEVSCGGSLITDRHVATAAHCFPDPKNQESLYEVVLGVYNNCKAESTREIFKVVKVAVHEKYYKNKPWFDIALLTLERPAVHNTPICLPPPLSPLSMQAIVAGFGVMKSDTSKEPCLLQEVVVKVYSKDVCTKMLQDQEGTTDTQSTVPITAFCAGYMEGGKDSCQGDSGGPLQAQNADGKFVLEGLVSFGYGCAARNALGVYTQLSLFLDWLNVQTDGATAAVTPTPSTETSKPTPHRPVPSHHHHGYYGSYSGGYYSVWDKIKYYENLKKSQQRKNRRHNKSRKQQRRVKV